jgi:predicted nucleotidyltransferase
MYQLSDIQRLADRLAHHLRPEMVVLFGSFAKGSATPSSDVDLLIVMDTPLPPRARGSLVNPYLTSVLLRVDAHVYTPTEFQALKGEEFSFLHSVMESGKVMYRSPPKAQGEDKSLAPP